MDKKEVAAIKKEGEKVALTLKINENLCLLQLCALNGGKEDFKNFEMQMAWAKQLINDACQLYAELEKYQGA
jgi:hypothetical protein